MVHPSAYRDEDSHSSPTNAMKILHTYRGLLRRVRRLPLDLITLERAKSELKNRFKDSHGPQSSLVTKWQATFDAILLRHDYSRIHDVFDDLFKKRTRDSMPKWLYQLRETDYLKLKPYWPQVELIQEIIDNKSNVVTKYDQKLARQRTNDICVYDFLKLDKQRNNSVEMYDLSPIKRQLEVPTDSYKCIVERAKELFDFLMKNHSRLDISNKVANFEMIYEPTTTGLPWSADYRDLRLRKHISNIKLLFESNLPMKQDDLAQLSSIMLDPNFTINPIFYKVMIREREKALETPPNPLVSKHLQLKQLVPSKRNIIHFYRLYLLRQYYIDQLGNYHLSWFNNYYESDPELLIPYKHISLSVSIKNPAKT